MTARTPKIWLLLGCVLLSASAEAAEPEVTKRRLSVKGQTCSALLTRPAQASALLVLAHGAQMKMSSPFMESISAALAQRGIATLRFNFPYAEAGRSTPDPQPVLLATVRAAVAEGARQRGALPLLVGGKSLAGLIVTTAASQGLAPARGLVILGFPLHQAGRPSALNARGLERVPLPMLFVQGTRDPLADVSLMRGLVEQLGERASLHEVPDADHQYALPPESARSEDEVMGELAGAIAEFAATLGASRAQPGAQ